MKALFARSPIPPKRDSAQSSPVLVVQRKLLEANPSSLSIPTGYTKGEATSKLSDRCRVAAAVLCTRASQWPTEEQGAQVGSWGDLMYKQ